MKNKIVKALVLASIVSMTATGAAGLTFADENVATGDTATSTTDTATKKTVDDLEADLTKAQKTAGEKEAAFTEKLAAYTDAKKAAAVTEDKKALEDALKPVEKKNKDALSDLQTAVEDVETKLTALKTKIDASEEISDVVKKDFSDYLNARNGDNGLKQASINYYNEVDAFVQNAKKVETNEYNQNYNATDAAKRIADLKKKYDKAKSTLSTLYNRVSSLMDGNAVLTTLLDEENRAITAYEETLDNLLNAAKALDALPKSAEEKAKALETAKADLKTATEAYKKALTDLGTAKSAYEEATADLVQIYRLYHPATHEHLWTKDANEKNVLSTERGWIYEGVAWLTKKKGTDAVPLYRLVYPFSGDHHYTTSENEVKDLTTKYGWISEDVAFYVPKEGDVPVYRLFNPGLKMGAHHFTTGENEYNTLGERGWTKENVAYKVSAKGALDTSEIKTEDSRIADAEKIYVEQP